MEIRGSVDRYPLRLDHDQLCLRLDLDKQSQQRQAGLTVELQLQTPEQHYRLSFSLAPPGPDHFLLSQRLASGSWQEIGPYQSICQRKIVELAVPFKDLQLTPGQELRMTLLVSEHRMEVARYPHHRPATLVGSGRRIRSEYMASVNDAWR